MTQTPVNGTKGVAHGEVRPLTVSSPSPSPGRQLSTSSSITNTKDKQEERGTATSSEVNRPSDIKDKRLQDTSSLLDDDDRYLRPRTNSSPRKQRRK
jgi:hypothetical protein